MSVSLNLVILDVDKLKESKQCEKILLILTSYNILYISY